MSKRILFILSVISTALPLSLVVPLCKGQNVAGSTETKLSISISGPSGTAFYIPVLGQGEMIAVVPTNHAKFVGIRVIPAAQSGAVSIRVSALLANGNSISTANCGQIQEWPSEQIGVYTVKRNHSVLLSRLKEMGLDELKFEVVPAKEPPSDASSTDFCECGTMVMSPKPGKCMGVVGCGYCCRIVRTH